VIGTLFAIDHTERVWYAHWAQAYVRSMFASLEKCHPAILAKCSHDLDLIAAWAGSPCKTVSSVGDLRFFKREDMPVGATERCLDCPHMNTCPYSAKRMYIDLWHERGEPEYRWPFYTVALDKPTTEEKLRKGLREGPYGRCAFRCKVDMVDHQLVQMEFENGVKASLKMVLANTEGRRTVFYGSHGEIIFDERKKTIDVMSYGGEAYTIDVVKLGFEDQSHGGGDLILVDEMYGYLLGDTDSATALAASIEPHLMGIAAEESRKRGGKLILVHGGIKDD
jgi:predicted dehydrogenase